MVNGNLLRLFWGYLEFYPHEDAEGYDGIHQGGIKGIKDNAPEEAKQAFAVYQEMIKEAEEAGEKL